MGAKSESEEWIARKHWFKPYIFLQIFQEGARKTVDDKGREGLFKE